MGESGGGGGRPPDGEVEKPKDMSSETPVVTGEVGVVKERAPEGWMTTNGLVLSLKVNPGRVKKIVGSYCATHPEWFKFYLDKTNNTHEHLHPNLVMKIKEELSDYIKSRDRLEPAPEGWMTRSGIFLRLKRMGIRTHQDVIQSIINRLSGEDLEQKQKWINKKYLDAQSKSGRTHYHPEFVEKVIGEFGKSEGGEPPSGWEDSSQIYGELKKHEIGVGWTTLQPVIDGILAANPDKDWSSEFWHKNVRKNILYYHPDLVLKVIEYFRQRETKKAPEGWMTKKGLQKCLKDEGILTSEKSIQFTVECILAINPGQKSEWVKDKEDKECLDKVNKFATHYHPDLVLKVIEYFRQRETKKAPEGWMTIGGLADLLGVDNKKVKNIADPYRKVHPAWFKCYLDATSKESKHLHPALVTKVKAELGDYLTSRESRIAQEKLSKAAEVFVAEIAKGKTPTAQEFQALISAIGPSRYLDILYKFRPEFKDLSVEYVEGIIADYLGDYLVARRDFVPAAVEVAAPYMSELTFQEGLYENLKEKALHFYFERRRAGEKSSGDETVYAFLDHLVESFSHLHNKEIDDVIQRVVSYYDSVFNDFHKPENFVDALDEEREFPDINQRINMKELVEKRRLLIADEMGLGKSASVIMAKEHLGARCVMVVAPSNVISTWERYLSDNREQGGYYKAGMAPRVLVINEPEDLPKLSAGVYDFILISQEKMNARYTSALKAVDYDMVVVDEIHKLKSLESVRAPQLLELAEKVSGDGKYLALLSGTPVPNKINDLAVILKLLYPGQYSKVSNKQLVKQIIHGEIINLRSQLVPRMQQKYLRDTVEMPPLEERDIIVDMTQSEKDVYEVLLEEDELDVGEKIRILRKFLLNPKSVDATPGIESAKINRVSEELASAFREHDRVVLYVNDYIENIIRGDQSIVADLAPAGVEIRIVHGEVSNKSGKSKIDDREAIRQEFNTTNKKMLLIVSGQTADVGVDYSGADKVFFYNEPWRETDKLQQQSRVYRPGLVHPLESGTFITKGTIEEGMHEYIRRKYIAVQKLLQGVPNTDLERTLLREDEKSKESDISVNPELARYYFSSWDKMMRFFGFMKDIGEERFKDFLENFATDYAGGYADLGSRSYQSNANRAAGTIISVMAKEMGIQPESARIIDLASGPEMLKQHIGEEYQERVFSVDLNKEHFTRRKGDKKAVGSVLALPFADDSFDFANNCLSFHYLNFAPSRGRLQRLQSLVEMNRVLKVGGRVVINLVYSLELRDFGQFKKVVDELGFRVVDGYSGEAKAGNNYHSYFITLEKITTVDQWVSIADRSEQIGKENLNGLKFNPKKGRLKDSRRVITEFQLGDKMFPIKLNETDQAIFAEEQKILREGDELKQKYGTVEQIPREEIVKDNFVRIKVGEKYKLFKKLVTGPGVVLVN